MEEKQVKLILGSLLHDIGKVLYRAGDGRNHSKSGYDFLKEVIKIDDREILDQVRYHHGKNLSSANIDVKSLAYITYIADNIAAKIDRRTSENEENGFDINKPLGSVFNILNGNNQTYTYEAKDLSGGINYPTNKEKKFSESFYKKLKTDIENVLNALEYNECFINSLLAVLEAYLTYIPSSTSNKELADISLYDHVKITAAISSCIYEYLVYNNINDYKQELFKNTADFYDKKVFLLYSMDISGIQDFIYTISSDKALRALRSRSFYLEIMMEHIIDELLSQEGLSRANRIYCGGGHVYLLLPNTNSVKTRVDLFEQSLNQWFLKTFKTALYIAGGYCECSANELNNTKDGCYKNLFRTISANISSKKMNRYTANDIKKLNYKGKEKRTRECKVCKRTDNLIEDKCSICTGLEKMSEAILYNDFFIVVEDDAGMNALPLPNDKFLVSVKKEKMYELMKTDSYVRCYSKNEFYTGYEVATKLWVGDYTAKSSFSEFANEAMGIKRIAVLRADIDNLGQAFVSGFESEKNKEKYVTISRTATFSRQLSLFFKKNINDILSKGENYLDPDKYEEKRNITIVYSGGDDVFVVGSWDEVIGFAMDLHEEIKKFGQNTISISAGIGIYPEKYPISVMAQETGRLEDAAKGVDGKNAVALFDEESVFKWDCFMEKVIDDKYNFLRNFFEENEERGKNFLYNLLNLIRNRKNKINIAKYAYMLTRLAPDEKADDVEKQSYKAFSKQMYQWIQDEQESKQLITAIYLYVYSIRESEE